MNATRLTIGKKSASSRGEAPPAAVTDPRVTPGGSPARLPPPPSAGPNSPISPLETVVSGGTRYTGPLAEHDGVERAWPAGGGWPEQSCALAEGRPGGRPHCSAGAQAGARGVPGSSRIPPPPAARGTGAGGRGFPSQGGAAETARDRS